MNYELRRDARCDRTRTAAPHRVAGRCLTLPFANNSFDAVVALARGLHFAQLDALLTEMRRIVVAGGLLVFDTYMWSPRALLPLDQRRWGTGIYIHPPRVIQTACAASGLQVVGQTECFLFFPLCVSPFAIARRALAGTHGNAYPPALARPRLWQIAKPA